jgi:DNA-directed RNA polymerase subunit RPC12/RpoP
MKIIQNNYIKENEVSEEYICEECNSVFEYNDSDIWVDSKNYEYVTCPCCNHSCIVSVPITERNIEFPKSFYQFGIRDDAVDIDNEEITSWIKEIIVWLKRHPEEPYKYSASGNTFVCVFNHEDEYYVMVAKNYFDASIDK